MRIKINNYDVEVHPSDTIWSLKWKIYDEFQRRIKIPPERLPRPDDQRLFLEGGKEMCDCEKTLEFWDIHEGTNVNCEYETPCGEEDFRRFLDVVRKKERSCLRLRDVTQVVGVKYVCSHIHEVGSMHLSAKGVSMTSFHERDNCFSAHNNHNHNNHNNHMHFVVFIQISR
jgi:hypothetical protein